ncbi:hypothetical protein [Pseudanabaena sp. FACHB-2040]|uniref:acyl carrier protein n=1 Tax=Pseudanabaena sp. FACHB-2040 TaxID=2692859 RepID=UPI001689FBEA|nr:hypothetical protein [Pseudanabaena sp. FACHB-2040]MBD2259251.1 hypothetical protein [Pseudanabaena sp. FACHB-2040]
MWQPFRNFVSSLQTYHLLSPDLAVRQQVNRQLRSRPCLSCQEWFIRYWTPPAVPEALPSDLVEFTFNRLAAYSGLRLGQVQPQDRLLEDLQFPLVCWFDWGLNLCGDFEQRFGIDITDSFDETSLITVADLVEYLYQEFCQH